MSTPTLGAHLDVMSWNAVQQLVDDRRSRFMADATTARMIHATIDTPAPRHSGRRSGGATVRSHRVFVGALHRL
jgi:hypothetical protein